LALLGLQNFEGAWVDPQKLQDLCGVQVKCPTALAGKNEVWATTLAVAILRVRFKDRKSEWTMIERKALQWLASQGVVADATITELSGQL
jgi:hypothetical protein